MEINYKNVEPWDRILQRSRRLHSYWRRRCADSWMVADSATSAEPHVVAGVSSIIEDINSKR